MNCNVCGNITNLVASQGMGNTVRRWRKCPKCGNKFYTYEFPDKIVEKSEELTAYVKDGVN